MGTLSSIVSLHLPKINRASWLPSYPEEPLFLKDPQEAFTALAKIDWAFEQEETGFLAHDIHPYPAKFIPQIPGTLIAKLSCRGELVLDPFGGSGTTALEAVRLGRRAVSIDANPLSALIGRTKTAWIDRSASLELQGLHSALASELESLPSDPSKLVALHRDHAPTIPNRTKWFADSAFGELCLIKSRISQLDSSVARDVSLVALSRIAIKSSFQDSETRYTSSPRTVPVGETLHRFLKELGAVVRALSEGESATRYGISAFIESDIRTLPSTVLEDGSVDLVVTSPPYGNATDYHLYHRFRLLWLGFDPVALGKIEIGSHLRHQREGSGFETYFDDLKQAVKTVQRVLRPERYAAFVLGDSVYEGTKYDPAVHLQKEADALGFDAAHIFKRPVHQTKRSFAHAGRRATEESILVLRKRPATRKLFLYSPPYTPWSYEKLLRLREAGILPGKNVSSREYIEIPGGPAELLRLSNLAFTHKISGDGIAAQPTWQAALENGGASNPAARKEPKYATHGLHPYKGKFYPQLAKGLINLSGIGADARILDPFCGSGTTLLEGYLNGFESYGCDLHPLAAKVARAKTEILECNPDVVSEAVETLQATLSSAPRRFPESTSEFADECIEEINRWFPPPVVAKMNWLLRNIRRLSAGPVQDFLEVVLSSIVREVSQQDPSDLRIRYRRELLLDADVLGLYSQQLAFQFLRVQKFWRVRGRAPWTFKRAHIECGDNRNAYIYEKLGLLDESVDLVLTSPPYATALPYIDTDRLSLLTLFGLSSSERRPLENKLTGSREITQSEKRHFEQRSIVDLPKSSLLFLKKLNARLQKDTNAGFRKQNMPALLTRYLFDMRTALQQCYRLCRAGAEIMLVIGDNKMELQNEPFPIPTTSLVEDIAVSLGLRKIERINISVTTESLVHLKNAITENVVLRFQKL